MDDKILVPREEYEKLKKAFDQLSEDRYLSQTACVDDLLNAEETISESEERYHTVFENSPISIWEEDFSAIKAIFDDLRKNGIVDIESYFNQYPEILRRCADLVNIIDVNQAALTLHGAANKKELLAGLAGTFTPDSFEAFRQELVALWKGHTEMSVEATVKTFQGVIKNVTVYYSVCHGCQDSLSKILVSLTDITERKLAEQKLQILNFALNNVYDEVYLIDESANFKYVNEKSCHALGYRQEELLKMSVGDVDPDFPQERWDEHWQAIRQKGSLIFEGRHKSHGGHIYPVEISANYFEYNGCGYNLALSRDITARKQAEQKMAQLAAIVESSDDVIIGKSLDGTVTSWNKGAEKIYGYSEAEILGKSITILAVPGNEENIHLILEKIKRGEHLDHFETVRRRKDGQLIHMSLTVSPVMDAEGRIIGSSTIGRDITERILAEKALHNAALYARRLIEASLDPLVTISPSGKITDVNKATETVTGISREHLINNDFGDYFTETEKARAGYQKVLEQGFVRDYPLTICHLSGKTIDVLYNATVYKNEAGEVQGVFAAARDVTERKLAEEVLHRMNRELRAVTNCTQVLGRAEDEQTLLDEICRIICEEAGYRFVWVGYAENDDVKTIRPVSMAGFDNGYLAQAMLTWADIPQGRGPAGSAIRREKSVYSQDIATDPHFAPWRDNALARGYRSAIALPLKDENADVFGVMLIYSSDVNAFNPDEIRLIEELVNDLAFGITTLRTRAKRKQAEQQLHLSENRLNEAQRIAHVGWWELNLVTGKLEWSDEIYRIFEIDPLQFGASYDAFLNCIHPDDREMVNQAYTQSLESKTAYDIVHRLRFPDGRIKFVHEHCVTYYNGDGSAISSLGTVQDITERKMAEEEVQKLNQELEQRVTDRTAQLEAANKELESFAYSVSHDLRAPLRHIDGFVELLRMKAGTTMSKESQHFTDAISESSKRMGILIDDLLSFSRMGRGEMLKMQVDFNQLLHEVVMEYNPDVKTREVVWKIARLPVVTGDRAMLKIVWVNLISNALKFTQNRQPALIEIGYTQDNRSKTTFFIRDNGVGFDPAYIDKLFEVFHRLHRADEFKDTGIGIPKEFHQQIFERFRQVEQAYNRKYGGNGLGLAISKGLVELLGGTIWLESEPGNGSTFYFTVPTGN